jgi:hypothetical protein
VTEDGVCQVIHDDLTGWSSSDGLFALHDNEAIWLGIEQIEIEIERDERYWLRYQLARQEIIGRTARERVGEWNLHKEEYWSERGTQLYGAKSMALTYFMAGRLSL